MRHIDHARSAAMFVAALVLLPFGTHVGAQAAERASTAVGGVVVAGLGGTRDYETSFADSASVIGAALRTLAPGDSAATIELLGGGGGDGAVASASSDRAAVLEAIETQGARDIDTFALVLIGHGSGDARGWKFNLNGPDMSGDDLVAALATVRAPRQLVVLGASASGALLETLAQPGRVVVTATKSAGEINAVRFPAFFAEALGSDVADIDRNEILTVAEAFRYADARTREYYEERGLLASEHARLAGEEAASLAVARLGSLRLAGDDPAVAVLLDTRLVLERDYHALLARKADMSRDAYYTELETLMLSIAGLQRAIDRASGWSDEDA